MIIIGAGVCGIYQLYRLVELGVHTTVLEGGGDLGGTWYWNRYPGCRFDSESYTYGFSFSKELLDEWHWKERFSGQPENLRYLNHVADKFDLRKHMQFNCLGRVRPLRRGAHALATAAPGRPRADVSLPAHGARICSRRRRCPVSRAWTASKARRSTPTTGRRSRSNCAGKRVAVIGTGATGVQVDRRARRGGRRADRLPTAAQLVRAAQQRPDLRRGDGGHPRPLRRDLRQVPPHPGRASSTSPTGAASTR